MSFEAMVTPPANSHENAECGQSAMNTGKAPGAEGWKAALTREEIDDLLRMRDGRSWLTLGCTWAIVFLAMAAAARWPNPLVIVLALFVIGTRQLGLAVIMHDAAHRAYFSNKRVNDWVGSWLASYPIWSDLHTYRPYHLRHHAKNWTDEDPDKGLATPFPITKSSFRRKVWRDLSGQTGLKFLRFAIKRDMGKGSFRERVRHGLGNARFRGMLITNGVILGLLTAADYPWLYLLWVGAYLTTNTLVTRIRSIAEHAMPLDENDALGNTRTTLATWWERLLLAPNRVNYHLEHHLLMTVPHYNLPRMHALLRERGALDHALVTRGYADVLRQAVAKPEPSTAV